MYDFLLLTPHGNASLSLANYINQHKDVQVAPFLGAQPTLQGPVHFERKFRPWMKSVGVATREYHQPDLVSTLLKHVRRDTLIQTVRDPIESFVSIYRNEEMSQALYRILNKPVQPIVADNMIRDAVVKYITHAAAEEAFEAQTFRSHIILDVQDLKGDLSEGAVKRLWRTLVGDDNVPNAVFKPLGASPFHMLRLLLDTSATVMNVTVKINVQFEGDLLNGLYNPFADIYAAHETRLYTYPDAMQILPALGVSGPLHICSTPQSICGVPPVLRQRAVQTIVPMVEKQLRIFNDAYAEAQNAKAFTVDSLTSEQRAVLKAAVEADYAKFAARHPELAARWTVTRAFLGIQQ